MEVSSRGVFLLFLIFFMFFTPAGNPPRVLSRNERKELKQYLTRQREELQMIKNGTWGSLYDFLTGIKEYPVKPASPGSLLPLDIAEQARSVWNLDSYDKNHQYGTFYTNLSGTARGHWEKLKVDLIPINMTEHLSKNASSSVFSPVYADEARTAGQVFTNEKVGNITLPKGNLRFTFQEKDELMNSEDNFNSSVSLLEANMDILDENEDISNTIHLRGAHLRNTGNFVFTTNSLKFSGFKALPHLLLYKDNFEETLKSVVSLENRTLTKADKLTRLDLGTSYELYEDAVVASHKCEYIVYAHLHPSGLSAEDVDIIQQELESPMGRPHKAIPNMKLDVLLYSPDCGLSMASSQPLSGELSEKFYKRMRSVIMLGIILIFLQTVFTAVQMKDTSTPSTISRVSFYSVSLMSIFDGSLFFASLAFSIIESVALSFLAVSFLAFSLTAVFEMRYMVLIYRSQLYENVTGQASQSTASSSSPSSSNQQPGLVARADGQIVSNELQGTDASARVNPNPTTTPVEDERQIMGMIYSRFYSLLLGFLIISMTTSSWPLKLRRIYEYTSMIVLYSFWLPQIVRNVRRGSRKSFLWKFVVATSIIRLMPLMYVCLNPNNILHHRYDSTLALTVGLWVVFQLSLLIAQNVFGPRFFCPKGYLSNLYDYHPVLTEEDIESGFNYSDLKVKSPNVEEEAGGSSPDEGLLTSKPVVDCAICMMSIELVVVPRDGAHLASTPANLLARRRYMVTPCKHVFHSECMERWMRTRLQCPVCRNPLPPI